MPFLASAEFARTCIFLLSACKANAATANPSVALSGGDMHTQGMLLHLNRS